MISNIPYHKSYAAGFDPTTQLSPLLSNVALGNMYQHKFLWVKYDLVNKLVSFSFFESNTCNFYFHFWPRQPINLPFFIKDKHTPYLLQVERFHLCSFAGYWSEHIFGCLFFPEKLFNFEGSTLVNILLSVRASSGVFLFLFFVKWY